jgi:hypothetical protein
MNIIHSEADCWRRTAVVSHKVTFLAPEMDLYMPNMTSDDNRMEIRRNWDALMPRKFLRTISSPYLIQILEFELQRTTD